MHCTAWVTTAEPTALTADSLQARLEATRYPDQVTLQADAAVELSAVELDLATGKILRRLPLLKQPDPAPIHTANSYASPTPVSDGQRVYCDFGSLGTVALDIESGAVVWRRQLEIDDISGLA